MIATTATATPPSRPSSDILWAQLADIDDLVESGDRRRALSKARRLLDTVDGAAREELADLVASIERTRDSAWEARDTRQPTRWEHPRNAMIRRVEPQPARTTGQRADAQAARYLADQPDPVEPDCRHPDDDAAYDPEAEFAAAVEPLRGAACLGCGIERSSLDRATGDGVCESCRENPDAAPVVTRRRQITVGRRCAAVARQAGPRPGPGLRQRLRQLYTEADPADRPLIAEWVAYNDNRIPQAPRRRR
jgi:hypothetical protein